MAFTLFGKVQMDSTGFHRALTGMKAAAAPAGRQIGGVLSRNIMGVLGAAGAANVVKKTLQNAFDIRKDAGKQGIGTDTFQTLQKLSDRTGASIEDLAKKYRDGVEAGDEFAQTIDAATAAYKEQGNIINSETITKLAELKDKLNDLFGKLAPLLSQVVDGIVNVYDKINKVVAKGVDMAVNGKWKWTPFGPIPVQHAPDVPGIDTPEATQTVAPTAIQQAVAAATTVAQAALEEKEKKPVKEKSLGDLKVSEARSVGAYFGRAPGFTSPVEVKLDVLNREVRIINGKISTFR